MQSGLDQFAAGGICGLHDVGARVQRPQPCEKGCAGRLDVGFGQDDAVGNGDLAHGFLVAVECFHAIERIDGRYHARQAQRGGEGRMAEDGLQHRHRIGQAGGLDHDALERGNLPRLHAVDQVGQRVDQFAAHRAAQAAIGKLDQPVHRLLDKQMVDADLAEFVDDDRGALHAWRLQEPVEERRLARAEKSGQDCDRDRLEGMQASASDRAGFRTAIGARERDRRNGLAGCRCPAGRLGFADRFGDGFRHR